MKTWAKRCFLWLGPLLAAHLILSFKLSPYWPINLAEHFRPAEVLLLCLWLVLLLARTSRRLGLATVVCIAAALWASDKFSNQELTRKASGNSNGGDSRELPEIQVISFNVLSKNRNFSDVTTWIERNLSTTKKNLVFLMEITPPWLAALQVLKTKLPYAIEIARDDNFGVVLLSDLSLVDVSETHFESSKLPAIQGHLANGKIRIIGLHTLPPTRHIFFESREESFRALRGELEREAIPTLVFGDLNNSPWSARFRSLLRGDESATLGVDRTSELFESMPGLFRPHTWTGVGGLISAPIDHILYTREFRLEAAEVGPHLGSDHKPIISRF